MSLKYTKRALQVLRAVNAALENATDEKQLLDDVCRIAVEVGGYRFAWAGHAIDDDARSVHFKAHAGHHPDYLHQIHITWDESDTGRGPAGIAIRTLKPAIVQHIAASDEFSPWREKALEFGYHSVIALPLAWRGTPYGCLAILSAEPDSFNAEEAELLNELAASLSYGMNALRTSAAHEQAVQALRAERDTQEVLRSILNLSLENTSLEEKLDRTLELLFDIPWLTLERKGSVFLVDENSDRLRLVAKRHLSPVLHELCNTVDFGQCLCGKAAAGGELVFHSHMDHDHTTSFDGIQDHGHYCQPIRSANGVLGVLNLYVRAGHISNPLEVQFLEAVSDSLAGLIEREQSEQSRQRLVTLMEATPDLVTITDTAGNCLYCNESARQTLNQNGNCLTCEQSIFSHYPEEAAGFMRDTAYPMAMEAGLWEGELELINDTGESMPVSLLVMSHRDSHGDVAYLSTIARDIRDRINAERAAEALAVREKHFANSLINSLPGIFYLMDEQTRLIRWNSNLETSLGYSRDDLEQCMVSNLIADDSWETMRKTCNRILERGSAEVEIEMLDHTGRAIPYFLTGTLIEHTEKGKSIAGIGIDISYRKQLEQELVKRASTDVLTGTFNRLKMEETLEHELNRSTRYGSPLSIAMFDIDYFKKVNDTYGHDAGDEVLKNIAAITKQQMRDVDFLARWGGEEFMIISAETTLEQMHNLAERVRQAIAEKPTTRNILITASFGIGQYEPGETQKALLKRVDDALYQAKSQGRNQVRIAHYQPPKPATQAE